VFFPPPPIHDPHFKYFTRMPLPPTRLHILHLYKRLLRLADGLRLTDPEYYVHRVKLEFRNNRSITDRRSIDVLVKVGVCRRVRVANVLSGCRDGACRTSTNLIMTDVRAPTVLGIEGSANKV
jgi:hypothetical protein